MEEAGGEKGRNEGDVWMRLEVLEEGRLVDVVVNKLKEDGGIIWREEYVVLRRKYKLDSEYGSVPGCKEGCCSDWTGSG